MRKNVPIPRDSAVVPPRLGESVNCTSVLTVPVVALSVAVLQHTHTHTESHIDTHLFYAACLPRHL